MILIASLTGSGAPHLEGVARVWPSSTPLRYRTGHHPAAYQTERCRGEQAGRRPCLHGGIAAIRSRFCAPDNIGRDIFFSATRPCSGVDRLSTISLLRAISWIIWHSRSVFCGVNQFGVEVIANRRFRSTTSSSIERTASYMILFWLVPVHSHAPCSLSTTTVVVAATCSCLARSSSSSTAAWDGASAFTMSRISLCLYISGQPVEAQDECIAGVASSAKTSASTVGWFPIVTAPWHVATAILRSSS